MKRICVLVFLVLFVPTFHQASYQSPPLVRAALVQMIPECVWGAHCDVLNHCINGGSQGVGCDDSSGGCQSCYRGFTDGGEFVAVVMDKTTGNLIIVNVGPLKDVRPGDQLRAIGASRAKRLTNLRSGAWLTRYTKERPARSLRARVYRPSTGSWITSTWEK